VKKNKVAMTVLAGFSSLFLLACYPAASSYSEEEISSTSEQGSSSESSASSEPSSSSAPSAIYEGFTLTEVIRFFVDDLSDGLEKEACLYFYSIDVCLSSFFVEFEFNGGSKKTVQGMVDNQENGSSICSATLMPDNYYGQTSHSMTKATPYGFLA